MEFSLTLLRFYCFAVCRLLRYVDFF